MALMALLLALAASPVFGAPPDGKGPATHIIVFNPDVDVNSAVPALARAHGLGVTNVYRHALRGMAAVVPEGRLNALGEDPRVAYVEENLEAHALLHGNDFQILPEGIDRIDAESVTSPVDVDIAIIDSGIDLDHPDLNVFKAVDCTKGPSCEKGGDGDDDYFHGTHVAGTAAAINDNWGVVGVAPGARLWAVKVLRADGSGFFSDVIEGIDYVTAHANEIEVANMSLGGQGKLNSLRTALQNSVAEGVVHVTSAGNSSKDVYGDDGVFDTSDDFIPANYPEVAAISAMGDTDGEAGGLGPNTSYDTPDDTFASFTNFSSSVVGGNPVTSPGAAIDLVGPGVDVWSTYPGGLFAQVSGTSMSAPHVAGAAAAHIALNGRATDATGVATIRQALINSAQPQADWRPDTLDTDSDPDANHEGLVYVGSCNSPCGPLGDPPNVSITSPTDGATFHVGDSISFSGSASDTEDGDLTASLTWTSDIDGTIDTGGSFSAALTEESHTVTASVTDSDSNTGYASISVIVVNDSPVVSITAPTDATTFQSGEIISFVGSASDTEDGDLTASLAWSSDIDGAIGTGGSFSTTLTDGNHTVTASVTDSGSKSGSASVSITVGSPPAEPTTVSVYSITYATEGGKGGKKHLLITVTLMDDLADPESGASVSIDLYLNEAPDGTPYASGTGTTGTNGTVTFSLKNAPSGHYETTVTNVTAAGLTWDGVTPANEYDK